MTKHVYQTSGYAGEVYFAEGHFELIAIVGAASCLAGEALFLHRLWDMMVNRRTAYAKVF